MYDYFYYLALVPQIAAMIHYFRHRPETYWFYIILFFGPLGALATYERVLAQSSFAEARYHLAELLIKQGQKETGRQHLEKLIRDAASPDLPSYQRRQERRWARRAKALLAGLS
jgi:hypothetical protein